MSAVIVDMYAYNPRPHPHEEVPPGGATILDYPPERIVRYIGQDRAKSGRAFLNPSVFLKRDTQ